MRSIRPGRRIANRVAEGLTLELATGLGLSWDPETARAYAGDGETSERAWRLDGALEPAHSALRVLSAATEDGSALVLAAARPEGADGHDEETITAILVDVKGEVTRFEEALLSTQYAMDGSVRRIGLELYEAGQDYPLRGAGDATSTSASDEGGSRCERAELRFRLDGSHGVALYEILHRI